MRGKKKVEDICYKYVNYVKCFARELTLTSEVFSIVMSVHRITKICTQTA